MADSKYQEHILDIKYIFEGILVPLVGTVGVFGNYCKCTKSIYLHSKMLRQCHHPRCSELQKAGF